MQTMTDSQSIAAQTVVDNILSGKTAEFLTRPSRILLAQTGGGDSVHVSLIVGNEIVVDAQEISDLTTFPILPDNLLAEAAGLPGERVVLRVENRHASAARVVKTLLKVEPA
jgi:hypothetical protein